MSIKKTGRKITNIPDSFEYDDGSEVSADHYILITPMEGGVHVDYRGYTQDEVKEIVSKMSRIVGKAV